MSERFRRLGVNYQFAPSEVPVVLLYQRCRDRDDSFTCQVAVRTTRGETVLTRRLDLLSGFTSGAQLALAKELHELNVATPLDAWKALLREAAENVMHAHRKGPPFVIVEGEIERPPPPAWACRGVLLKHAANCWLGAASTGKSTLAKALCAYYASGFRFLDRETEQGTPLYLDWESDRADFERVVFDVCRNLGVWPLPRMLWRNMRGRRLRDQLETLAHVIDTEHVGLVVLDAVAAAGGSTGEHMTWEAIALEMEECLGALPPVTVLALDHVTGAEHYAQRNGRAGSKPPVPIKARGAERKLEYTRNQWSLVTDLEAEHEGRHVVEWTHTKFNLGLKEREPFATEIIHRPDEIAIVVRPIVRYEPEPQTEASQSMRLLQVLAGTSGRSPRELALEFDGHEPNDQRIRNVRTMLERAVRQGLVERTGNQPVRYRVTTSAAPDRPQPGANGLLIPFPGGPSEG